MCRRHAVARLDWGKATLSTPSRSTRSKFFQRAPPRGIRCVRTYGGRHGAITPLLARQTDSRDETVCGTSIRRPRSRERTEWELPIESLRSPRVRCARKLVTCEESQSAVHCRIAFRRTNVVRTAVPSRVFFEPFSFEKDSLPWNRCSLSFKDFRVSCRRALEPDTTRGSLGSVAY